MGKANRERRRMKAKARQHRATHRPGSPGDHPFAMGGGRPSDHAWRDLHSMLSDAWTSPPFEPATPPPSIADQVAALIQAARYALACADQAEFTHVVRHLGADPAWRRPTERALESQLLALITALWRSGWQPADVLRVVARRLKPAHLELARSVIAAELAQYAAGTVDPRWSAQLAEGEVSRWWPKESTVIQACARSHAHGWTDFLAVALGLLDVLATLPRLELLGPIPGTAVPQRTAVRPDVDERILARVRALLAKAESTDYPAEAETFTAGAQALMARHAIDHALLMATGRTGAEEPVGRRIGIDNPYEAPKASLLDAVAVANRSRVVWSKQLGFATVMGYPTDLDSVEVLFTSLLVQAVSAMNREGSRSTAWGGSRTRSFRQSFLLAYAHRIRERLTETTEEQTRAAAAEPGKGNLLPVLASRVEAVERATSEMFPQLITRSAGSAWDHEGWASGRAAADQASLTSAAGEVGPRRS